MLLSPGRSASTTGAQRIRRADRAPERCLNGPVGLAWREGPHRTPSILVWSIIVQDRAGASAFAKHGIAAQVEQVEEERLVRLALTVALHFDCDEPGRLI